jgi:hypothetical protein
MKRERLFSEAGVAFTGGAAALADLAQRIVIFR